MHGDEEKVSVDNVSVDLSNKAKFKSIISSTENKPINLDIASNPHQLLLHGMKKKFNLNKDITEEILKFLWKNKMLTCKDEDIAEPNFTLFGVSTLEQGVAQNLALHGNPFGGSNVQTRSWNKNKDRKMKLEKTMKGIGNIPAGFEDFVTIL